MNNISRVNSALAPRIAIVLAGFLLVLTSLLRATPLYAQEEIWDELPTEHFTIIYVPGYESEAEAYAGFVDGIYNEIATTFEHQPETPVTLRLFPSFESYYEVNPMARNMRGIVAHADFRHRTLAVVLPQTEQQTPDEIQNNIRHELTHLVASELSQNRLNTGFQEGIAQYIEIPTAETERKMSLLQQAYREQRLMEWSNFDDRNQIYGAPEQGYPQTLSAVTFLVETYGFDQFRTFLINSGESNGYRSALEQTYGIPSSNIEQQWREWLPSFLDGSYQDNPLPTYNLEYPRTLIEAGRYAEARTELEKAVERLRETSQDELLQEAEALLAESRDGHNASQIAAEARTALQAGNYERAGRLVDQARDAYAALHDTRQQQVLEVYAARVERGLKANEQLDRASEMARTLRFPQARANAEAAAAEFARLGDTARRNEAIELHQSMNGIQYLAGLTLITLGMLGVIVSLWGHWFVREPELW
jgi:hypothetical protein